MFAEGEVASHKGFELTFITSAPKGRFKLILLPA
jgi:hypothetical protein